MNKHSRLITALLALILCLSAISLFSTAASAETGDGEETPIVPDPDPVYTTPITPEPDPVYTEPVYVDPDPQPVYTDPVYVVPGNGGNNSGSGNDSGNGSSDDNSGSNSSGNDVYYDSNGNEYSDQSEVYVGGGQSYEPPVSTAPSAPLIKTQDNIDVNELSKNDWNDIKASLEKANKNGGVSDSDDFSFIQKNTAQADNGHMLLVLGIAMVILSLAGFGYLIGSGVMRRKKKAAAASKSGSHAAGAPRYRSDSDYDDGYRAASKQKPVSDKKASRFDTAKIPKTKSKGGKRYK